MSTMVMSIPATIIPDAETPPVPSPQLLSSLYRMTVDRYDRLVAAGMLDDPKVELIQGLLVRKMSKNPPHMIATGRLFRLLDRLLPAGWHLRQEGPVRIPDLDEPEPDIAVVAGAIEDYLESHPGPGNLALLVEVAESSLDRDQHEKQTAYARGGVPYYWIVNLVDRQVEVYADPRGGRYQDCHIYPAGSEVPVVIAGVEVGRIAVDAILPPLQRS
jgi:Uma2 family endonuclease